MKESRPPCWGMKGGPTSNWVVLVGARFIRLASQGARKAPRRLLVQYHESSVHSLLDGQMRQDTFYFRQSLRFSEECSRFCMHEHLEKH